MRFSQRAPWAVSALARAAAIALGALKLEKHPDKTFIGRQEFTSAESRAESRGFDFLGYRFSPAGLPLAQKTVANFIDKASRLYEQERNAARAAACLRRSEAAASRRQAALEMYVRQWLRWAMGGGLGGSFRLIPLNSYGS
jgi:hypothetical protein